MINLFKKGLLGIFLLYTFIILMCLGLVVLTHALLILL